MWSQRRLVSAFVLLILGLGASSVLLPSCSKTSGTRGVVSPGGDGAGNNGGNSGGNGGGSDGNNANNVGSGNDSYGTPDYPSAPPVWTSRKIPAEIQPDVAQVVDGNTAFALDLYRRLKDQPGNLFLCPYSISTAFAMTWAGARGATEAEMAGVFHFPFGQKRLHPAFEAVQGSLAYGSTDPNSGYQLQLASRLWGQQGYSWIDLFLAVTRNDYGAELQQMDFERDWEGSRQTINQWVSTQTGGNIADLLPPGSLDKTTRLVLTNAVYFAAPWKWPFDPHTTYPGDFHTGSGTTVTVPTMYYPHASCGYMDQDGVQVLDLPYKDGHLSMVFLLPDDPNGLSALEASLTPARLAAWMAALQGGVDVFLPRFSFRSRLALKQTLQLMGMTSAFDGRLADFSGMDGRRDLLIRDAYHQTFVQVTEAGTVATGATSIAIGMDSWVPSFTADHPFLFLIRDKLTGTVLFIGRVVDPSQ